MSDSVLHVRLDPELKQQAQETAKALGLPLSAVVSANLREFVQTRSLVISAAPRLKPDVAKELTGRIQAARKGNDVSPVFDNLDSAKKWLES